MAITRRELFALTAGAAAASAQTAPPNIVFILTDDQGWSSTSFQMHPEMADSKCDYLSTPNMAKLAQQGMRFVSGYAPGPICTPTRRSVQFGMTPARQRGTEFVGDFHPRGHLSLPQALKQANAAYRCAHFGKWGESITGKGGLVEGNDASPEKLGYDASDGVTGNVTGGMGDSTEGRFLAAVKDDPKLVFSMTKRGLEFMEKQKREGRPFYLQMSYYAIHRQVQSRAATLEKYKKKGAPPRQFPIEMAASLEDLDDGIGQLLSGIDRMGLAGNTYVFLMADNGGTPYPEYKGGGDPVNHPLRGAKQTLWEGGIRVPFLVRGPGVARNSWSHVPVTGYDLLPTFYDLAGGKAPLPAEVDGGSFRSVLQGGGKGTVKRALPGIVFHRPGAGERLSTLRVGDLKVVINRAAGRTELYDLGRDIREKNDLAAKMPEKTREMEAMLVRYLKEVNAETPPVGDGKKGGKKKQGHD